jgi:hypothetical protein
VVPVSISILIELAQLAVPGRDPSAGDLVFNTLGAASGVAIVRNGRSWLHPAEAASRRLAIVAALGFLGIVALTGLLLAPHFPSTTYWGLWAPELGHLEWYRADVRQVLVGSLEAPSGPLPHQAEIHDALRRGDPVLVSGKAGPPVRHLGALFAIYDERQREILLIGPEGGDLVVRYRSLALAAGLDQPDLRLDDVMSEIAPGQSLEVAYHRTTGGVCLAVTGRARECGLGFTPGRGWSFLQFFGRLPRWLLAGMDAAWVLVLVLPAGYWRTRRSDSAVAAGIVAVALLLLPGAVGLRPVTTWELGAAALALYAGRQLRVRLSASREPAAS